MSKENIAVHNPDITCCNCLKETDKIHVIQIPSMGYGSGFDGWSTQVNLCDECLAKTDPEWWKLKIINEYEYMESYEFEDKIFKYVGSMPLAGKELFWNRYSTDNYLMKSQDWIDYELGILPHEKCKEYGCYSHDEIKAYEERFPKCQHPVNRIWNDKSQACYCPFGSTGDYGQICSCNISDECYQCEYFTDRTAPIRDINNDDYDDYEIYYRAKLNAEKYKNNFGE
jgi:hypothetical protein